MIKKILIVSFLLISTYSCCAQNSYHFEKLSDSDIDSLVSDSLVQNEFKILNYCYCQHYLDSERIRSENVWRKKKIPLPAVLHYGYLGGGQAFSYYSYEKGKSFFANNNVDELDFSRLSNIFYKPIADYLRQNNDLKIIGAYSPVFECFYAVEKMALTKEMRMFIMQNRTKLILLKGGK